MVDKNVIFYNMQAKSICTYFSQDWSHMSGGGLFEYPFFQIRFKLNHYTICNNNVMENNVIKCTNEINEIILSKKFDTVKYFDNITKLLRYRFS